MPKHDIYRAEKLPPNPSRMPPHPIWRGIGCVMLVFIPILAFILASILVDNRNSFPWLIIPQDLIFTQWKDIYFAVRLLYAGFIILIVSALLALITFVFTRIFGPSKFGPYDIPPEKVQKRNKR